MRNAVIYARYSDQRQREESIEDQLKACRSFAACEGYTVVEEYSDYAMSARTDNRLQFQRMIRDSDSKGFSAVIVYKLDRFARDRYDMAVYRRRLRNNGVQVVSAMESIPDGPEGIMLEAVMEGMAEWYSANLSQNVKRGMYSNAEKCLTNGMTLYGYRRARDGRFEVDPEEEPYVKDAFQMALEGVSQTDIARYLNECGQKTTMGNRFQQSTVSNMLANRKYTGVYKFGDVIVDGGMPAIITEEVFHMVNNMAVRPKKNRSDVYHLSGKVWCGCGRAMVGTAGTSRNGDRHHYYTCQGLLSKECGMRRVNVGRLERRIIEKAQELLCDQESFDAILEAMVRFCDEQADRDMVRGLEKKKREVEKRIKNVIDLLAESGPDAQLNEKLQFLREESGDIAVMIESETARSNIVPADFIQFVLEKARSLDTSDEEECAKFLVKFVSKVTIDSEYISVEYHYNDERGHKFMQKYPCSHDLDVVPIAHAYANTQYFFVPGVGFGFSFRRAA